MVSGVMDNKKGKIGASLVAVIALCDIYMFFVKLHYGMHYDEPFLIAQAECFSRNIEFFRDSWSAFQFAGVIVAPLSYIYRIFVGSNEGLIYYFRGVWLVMQNVLAFYAYSVISNVELPNEDKKNKNGKYLCAAAVSLCLFFYFAYFYSVLYKTIAFWGCSFILLLIIDSFREPKLYKAILMGIVLSLATLGYESTAIMIVPILIYFYYMAKEKRTSFWLYAITIITTCMICAMLFISFVVSRIGINDFILYFPKFLGYEGYGDNIFIKVGKHLIYYIAAFIFNFILISVYERRLKEMVTLSKFLFGYVLIFAAIILFARPQSITISRVNYIMCVLYTLCMVLVLKYYNTELKKYFFILYMVPIAFYILSIAIATYQGIAVSSMGCILAVIPLALFSLEDQLDVKGIVGIITVMMIFMGLFVVPCVYTTNLTVFHYTEEIDRGPAKGIRPLDTYVNEDVAEWQDMIDKYVSDTDKPLMLGNEYYSLGYLYSDVSEYGTYSPGYVFLDSGRLVDFWNMNTDRQPTVAIIKTSDLPCKFEEFLSDYEIGKFLNQNLSCWSYDGEFAIGVVKN